MTSRARAIDRRTRSRRIVLWQVRQRLARESAAVRARRLALLAQLAGTVEAGGFDPEYVRAAHAALVDDHPDSPQARLALHGRAGRA